MRESIKTLLDMERIDLEIERLRSELDVYPRRIAELERSAAEKTEAADRREQGLAEDREERKLHEEEIGFEESRLRALKSKMLDVKTNAEYQALMREIEHVKRSIHQREEGAIGLIERIEAEEKLIKEDRDAAAALLKEKEELEAEWRAKRDEIEAEVKKLEEERNRIGSSLDPAVASKYRLIKSRRPGPALAFIDDGSCSNCHMNIPPQVQNEVLEMKRLHNCPSCFCILYYKSELEDQGEAG